MTDIVLKGLTMSKVLILIACICFVLAAFGIAAGPLALVPLGLALWSAAALL